MGSFPGEVTLARGKEIAILHSSRGWVCWAEAVSFIMAKKLVMGISHIVDTETLGETIE